MKFNKINNFKPPNKKPLNKSYIRIENPEDSKRIQKYLFSKGFNWLYSRQKIRYTDFPILVIYHGPKTILHCTTPNNQRLFTLEEIKKILR